MPYLFSSMVFAMMRPVNLLGHSSVGQIVIVIRAAQTLVVSVVHDKEFPIVISECELLAGFIKESASNSGMS